MYRLLVLCLCCVLVGRTFSEEVTSTMYEHCGNLQPQENIVIKMITGVWYVIEILQHKTDDKLYHGEKFEVPICPKIYLTTTGSESELKLFWKEDEGDVEYRFKIQDMSSPGLWFSTGGQNGSLAERTGYDQFAGFLYVRKAVFDHMVLTFCSPNTHLYSVVVARDMKLDMKELRSITNIMQKQKLPITQTRRTCRNASSISRAPMWSMIVALCLATTYAYPRVAEI